MSCNGSLYSQYWAIFLKAATYSRWWIHLHSWHKCTSALLQTVADRSNSSLVSQCRHRALCQVCPPSSTKFWMTLYEAGPHVESRIDCFLVGIRHIVSNKVMFHSFSISHPILSTPIKHGHRSMSFHLSPWGLPSSPNVVTLHTSSNLFSYDYKSTEIIDNQPKQSYMCTI